jgi:rare lipoprotein A
VKLKRTIRSTSAFCLLVLLTLVASSPATSAGSSVEANAALSKVTTGTTDSGGPSKAEAPASISRVRLSSKRYTHGSRIKVRGIVDRRSKRVGLFFKAGDSKRWHRLKKVETDKAGRYATSVKARRNGQVKAISSTGVSSSPRKIRVRSQISVKPVKKYTPVGSRVLIRGSVNPAGKRWVKVVAGGRVIRTRSRANGRFRFSWRPTGTGSHRIRVFSAGNGAAASDASRRIRVTGLRQTHASYFGPGLYGGALACGGRLYPGTRGVAHKTLPCGSKVALRYRGRTVTTRVVDRGPFVAGREFDLTYATRNDLGFGDIGSVWTSR